MFQKKKEIFSNLNNFKENEIDINEEEYLWVKKRNERLKKNQNKENNKENKENENINNKIERFLSPKKEILNEINENIIITRREIKQEQQQEEEANNKANNKENKDIKTPSKSESKNNDNKKSSFKQQKQQKQEEQEEQQEVDQDIPVSIPSPSIQRSLSKLSIHSFSDSKESTPRSEKKYIINEDKESIQLTPKPLSSKKFKSPEIKQAFEQIASSFAPLLDSGSESDSEVIAPEIDNYKLQQEMLVEQLFSKVRHNRQQQVIQILRNGFDSNLTDRHGNTILHICAQNNLFKMAEICCAYGCSELVNFENKKGLTPLDYCDMYHFDQLGEWFVMMGGENSHLPLSYFKKK